MVGPNGLEPSTSSVSRKRSNQTELRAYEVGSPLVYCLPRFSANVIRRGIPVIGVLLLVRSNVSRVALANNGPGPVREVAPSQSVAGPLREVDACAPVHGASRRSDL